MMNKDFQNQTSNYSQQNAVLNRNVFGCFLKAGKLAVEVEDRSRLAVLSTRTRIHQIFIGAAV